VAAAGVFFGNPLNTKDFDKTGNILVKQGKFSKTAAIFWQNEYHPHE
jgi:hypothetical protein